MGRPTAPSTVPSASTGLDRDALVRERLEDPSGDVHPGHDPGSLSIRCSRPQAPPDQRLAGEIPRPEIFGQAGRDDLVHHRFDGRSSVRVRRSRRSGVWMRNTGHGELRSRVR